MPNNYITDLIKLNPELSSTLQRGGESVKVLTPEGKEFLDAKAAQRVVPCVTYPVLLTHWHHLVVHMQCVLRRAEKNTNVSTFLTNRNVEWSLDNVCVCSSHLYRYVEHKTRFPSVSHTHHSYPVGVADTHLLQTHKHTRSVTVLASERLIAGHKHNNVLLLEISLCTIATGKIWRDAAATSATLPTKIMIHTTATTAINLSSGTSGSRLCFLPYRTWRGSDRVSWKHTTARPEHPLHEAQ